MSDEREFSIASHYTDAEAVELCGAEINRLRAALAERDDRLARIAATAQSLLPALDKVDVVTMEASSGIRKLFIQSRMVIGLVEVIAKGEQS